MFWHIVAILCGLSLTFLAASALLVALTPRPSDPWRTQPVPADGEYVKASDGAEIFVRHWLPAGQVTQVVLGLHGLGTHGGYQRRAGEASAAAGIAYYAPDLRGNGLTRTPHGDIPSVERLYADLDDLLRMLQQRHPGARIYVLGHSLGGAVAITWAAERQPAIAGLLALAPAMTAESAAPPWLNNLKGPAAWLCFRHRAALGLPPDAYDRERLRGVINLPEEVEFTATDPLHLQGISMALGVVALQVRRQAVPLAPRVRVPTLVLVGEADPARVGASQFYDGLQVSDRRYVALPHTRHNLFQLQETPLVIQEVLNWLKAH